MSLTSTGALALRLAPTEELESIKPELTFIVESTENDGKRGQEVGRFGLGLSKPPTGHGPAEAFLRQLTKPIDDLSVIAATRDIQGTHWYLSSVSGTITTKALADALRFFFHHHPSVNAVIAGDDQYYVQWNDHGKPTARWAKEQDADDIQALFPSMSVLDILRYIRDRERTALLMSNGSQVVGAWLMEEKQVFKPRHQEMDDDEAPEDMWCYTVITIAVKEGFELFMNEPLKLILNGEERATCTIKQSSGIPTLVKQALLAPFSMEGVGSPGVSWTISKLPGPITALATGLDFEYHLRDQADNIVGGANCLTLSSEHVSMLRKQFEISSSNISTICHLQEISLDHMEDLQGSLAALCVATCTQAIIYKLDQDSNMSTKYSRQLRHNILMVTKPLKSKERASVKFPIEGEDPKALDPDMLSWTHHPIQIATVNQLLEARPPRPVDSRSFVVVGATDIGVGVLEELIYHPDTFFPNLTLVGDRSVSLPHLVDHGCYSSTTYARLGIPHRARHVSTTKIKEIDTERCKLVIAGHAHIHFDFLVLASDLERPGIKEFNKIRRRGAVGPNESLILLSRTVQALSAAQVLMKSHCIETHRVTLVCSCDQPWPLEADTWEKLRRLLPQELRIVTGRPFVVSPTKKAVIFQDGTNGDTVLEADHVIDLDTGVMNASLRGACDNDENLVRIGEAVIVDWRTWRAGSGKHVFVAGSIADFAYHHGLPPFRPSFFEWDSRDVAKRLMHVMLSGDVSETDDTDNDVGFVPSKPKATQFTLPGGQKVFHFKSPFIHKNCSRLELQDAILGLSSDSRIVSLLHIPQTWHSWTLPSLLALYNVHHQSLNHLLYRIEDGLIERLEPLLQATWALPVLDDGFRGWKEWLEKLGPVGDHAKVQKVREYLEYLALAH